MGMLRSVIWIGRVVSCRNRMICCVGFTAGMFAMWIGEWMCFRYWSRREERFLGTLCSDIVPIVPSFFIVELVLVAVDDDGAICAK